MTERGAPSTFVRSWQVGKFDHGLLQLTPEVKLTSGNFRLHNLGFSMNWVATQELLSQLQKALTAMGHSPPTEGATLRVVGDGQAENVAFIARLPSGEDFPIRMTHQAASNVAQQLLQAAAHVRANQDRREAVVLPPPTP